jgi:NDP-sugar pyrophosphorylase family protein
MLLAGGLSTRLYPLTKQVPKPLVPVVGEPNAAHVLRYLASFGIAEIAMNVHYLGDAIVAALGDGSRYGVTLTYLHEHGELLGSAGAVKAMEPFLRDGTFVVIGCDDLTDIRLTDVVEFHRQRRALATIALVECDDVEQYGVVVTDADGKIVGFQEKPAKGTERSRLVNTGVYVFEPEILARIPASTFYDFGKQVFPALQRAGDAFYGFDARGAYWCDIGTIDEYKRATRDVVDGRFRIPGVRGSGIDRSARIAAGAIEGKVWIGANAEIAEGARIIGPSVIGTRAVIGRAATIHGSILWDDVRIGEGAVLLDTIVGNGYEVTAGARLEHAAVANEDPMSS